MSAPFDNFIALKVLYMLVTPFEKTTAFKLGVIDKEGKLLIKIKDQSFEQKESYTYLDRLVFNLKRLIGKLPGGKSMLGSLVAALYLVKEDTKLNPSQLEARFNHILTKILEQNITLVEETIAVEKFLKELSEDGAISSAPANVTGLNVSTDVPAIKPKKKTPIAKRKLQLKA